MPILHLRAVPSDLMTRIKTSARDAKEPIDQHAIALLDTALDAQDARSRGGRDRAARMTDEQRSESARRAAAARWAKRDEAVE